MKLIAVCDKNWAIGRNNDLLFSLPADMKHFRSLTQGKTVVLGSNTLRSFPNGKPLKNRRNIVLSRNLPQGEGYEVVGSVSDLFALLGETADDVFVIGGASVYKELLDYCDGAIITKVNAEAQNPDKFFPDLDALENWVILSESEPTEDNGYEIRFVEYKNVAVKKFNRNA